MIYRLFGSFINMMHGENGFLFVLNNSVYVSMPCTPLSPAPVFCILDRSVNFNLFSKNSNAMKISPNYLKSYAID